MTKRRNALKVITAVSAAAAMVIAAGCGSSTDSGDGDTNTSSSQEQPAGDDGDTDADDGDTDTDDGDTDTDDGDTDTDDGDTDADAGDDAPAEPLNVDHAAPDGSGETLNVWLQGDTVKDIDLDALNEQFEADTGATVNFQEQSWGEYTTKVLTGLADTTADAPDVIELGNTQVAGFADQLATLDKNDYDNNNSWLKGLEEAGTYNGDFVGVPYYAGVRVGIIRTDFAEEAGVDYKNFNSLADLQAGAAQLLESHGDDGSYSGLLFPSRYWYEGMSFIWDFGGEIATGSDADGWTGGLSSAESQAGVQALKDLYDAASRNAGNTDEGEDAAIMRADLAGIILDPTWMPGVVASVDELGEEDAAALAEKLDVFVVPSHNEGDVMPQFLGGSNIVVPAQSSKQDLASYYVYLLTGNKYQQNLADAGYITNSPVLSASAAGELANRAASTGRFIPNSKNWSQVEDAAVLADFFDDVLANGVPIADAAADADAQLESLLNG